MGTKILDVDTGYSSSSNPSSIGIDASAVNYTNGTSGLSATDAQAAIDEVEARLDTAESDITTVEGRLDSLEDKDFGNVTSVSSSSYTVLSTDSVILVDASSNDVTLNLPTAVGINGKEYVVKRIDDASSNTYDVIVDGSTTETLDGDLVKYIATKNGSIRIVSDNANWQILDMKDTILVNATTDAGGSYGAAWTTLLYEDEETDNSNSYDNTTGIFTSPAPRTYCITGAAAVASINNGQDMYLGINHNNTASPTRSSDRARNSSGGALEYQCRVYDEIYLAKGDTIHIGIFSDATKNLLVSTNQPNVFTIHSL